MSHCGRTLKSDKTTRKQPPEVTELAKSSPWREPPMHMESNAKSRLFWDKTTSI